MKSGSHQIADPGEGLLEQYAAAVIDHHGFCGLLDQEFRADRQGNQDHSPSDGDPTDYRVKHKTQAQIKGDPE